MGKKKIGRKRRFSSRGNERADKQIHYDEQKSSKSDDDIIEIFGNDENDGANIPSSSAKTIKSEVIDTIDNLLCATNFVLIQGPFGCGKTYSARILSERRGVPLHILQINEQYDSKILYGSYNCTEVPGEFIWQESKFAQFIKQPCLILLENIDHGGSELASAIIALLENGRVNLLNGKRIIKNQDCQILATISVDENYEISKLPLQLCEYPYTVKMPELGEDAFNSIIADKFPRLITLKEKLIQLFFDVNKLIRNQKTSVDRSLNSKDLFRAAARLQSIRDLQDGKRIFMELIDIWAMHLTNQDLRTRVAVMIAEMLSLADGELNCLMNVRRPEIVFDRNKINIGRAQLESKATITEQNHFPKNFVLTLDSSQLIEKMAVCIEQNRQESILLTGDTGVGKTSAVQYLANLIKVPLRVVNLSQESEFTDLIGGYKPTSPTNILRPLADDYFKLFKKLFGEGKNVKFLENLNKCFNAQRFGDFLHLLIKSSSKILKKYSNQPDWKDLLQRSCRLVRCFGEGDQWKRQLLFSYVKGIMAESTEQGYWLLVDEINLASPECLDVLVELLEPNESIHPDFRLFACMNHATDFGKRSLPNGIRSRFTEFYVSETTDPEQLRSLINGQLPSLHNVLIDATLHFYLEICAHFSGKFSLRTLSRALSIAGDQLFSCQWSCLVHGCKIAFSSQLGFQQRLQMHKLVEKHFQKGNKFSTLNTKQLDHSKFILIENNAILRGTELIVENDDNYIFTPSVRANMAFLASVVATGKFPILMEGETSAGKTSMIIQLAKMSGNRCYRINNHEHTDIQEYIGNYSPDEKGRLQFVEGILLRAVKNGYWIILDELNLAPSSVLEALNRLLDDNRELFVHELNITIKAHPRFQLFATQNPVGNYAGRKLLSRAFLNRFLVIQCESLPLDELSEIVYKRCGIAPTQANLMVNVLRELKSQRAISGMFTFSEGLMTLRDLFRWANRVASLESMEDWRQSVADQGYFVLVARCRTKQDENAIMEVLEKQMNRRIDIDKLFNTQSSYLPKIEIPANIVLTMQLRRMLILCSEAWKCKEPVLLVGETGCGKTTAVHLFGSLLSINCHERTDAADLLGSIRPITNGGFRWQDGIVLQAMRKGAHLLIDEISLAPDSVLERLNSLLEPQRTILLTDVGASSDNFEGIVTALPEFQFVATMNPGNDHGKKELSKALRNRFTEVWCPQEHNQNDLLELIKKRLFANDNEGKLTENDGNLISQFMMQFSQFFAKEFHELLRFTPSTRDLVGLAELFMEFYKSGISLMPALYHSIEANFFDALGVISSKMTFNRQKIIEQCQKQFQNLAIHFSLVNSHNFFQISYNISLTENAISIGPFKIDCPDGILPKFSESFTLNAPTTRKNALRIARALYSNKPIMLEGSPGAGKSSLVMAIAAATGHKLVRLNLSEQTDLYDLFGSDIPIVGADGTSTTFAWRDGPVLKAIKEGNWILLDEMNLASQSVLEGLNSCFDFRKNIFISELNKIFDVDIDKCRFFACQNPHSQGGDRRALPKSFLNRFISIFIEEMTDDDFIYILCEFCKNRQEHFTDELISKMVLVNKMCQDRIQNSSWGLQNGGPFEFNLRDLFRWIEAIENFKGNVHFGFELVYLNRLKSNEAREKIIDEIFNLVFVDNKWAPSLPLIGLADDIISIGNVNIKRPKTKKKRNQHRKNVQNNKYFLMSTQMDLLEKLAACVVANWLVLLSGPTHSGKRSTLKILADICGQQMEKMQLNSATDALDLLGSYEQIANENASMDDNLMDVDNEEKLITKAESNIRFEWVDSVFLRAYRDGHWLLVEDVNCCNSAVLDCLNSCLESVNGELVLPVDEIKTIRRHPNFRIFFTMNPKNGQLSRSMRNRAIEIQFCTDENNFAHQSHWNQNIYDTLTTIFGTCPSETIGEPNSPETLHLLQKLRLKLNQISTKTLLNCVALMQSKMKWEESISNELEFQTALNVLLNFIDEQKDNCKSIEDGRIQQVNIFEAVPTEFPPLTRLPIPKFNQPFNEFLFSYYRRCFEEVANNIFPDESFSAVTSQLIGAMEEFILKLKHCGEGNIDHLIEETFPELRNASLLWGQLNERASNESQEGQNYLNALRTNIRCKPFKMHQQIKQFAKKWRKENEFLLILDEVEMQNKASFYSLKGHLTKLLHIFAIVNDYKTSASNLIPWKLPEEDTKLFSFLNLMSTRIVKILTKENSFGFNEGTLYSHLHGPYLTIAVNQLLWVPLHYSKNIMREIRIGQLKNAREQMEQTLELFWNLSFAQKGIGAEADKNWNLCQTRIFKNCTEEKWNNLIFKILDSIDLLTPPEKFVDPFYFAFRQSTFYELRMEKLKIYFQALQFFLQLTVSKYYDFEQISNAFLQMPHSPTFLKLLSNAWDSTISILNKLANEDEFDGKMWNDDENGRIYRGIWQHGEEMAYIQNYQNSIVGPLRWCSAHLRELINALHQNIDENIEEIDAPYFCAQLANCIQTIDSMIERILMSNSQLSLSIYPEIITHCLFHLNMLKIILSEQLRQINFQHEKRRKHQFIELNSFHSNLSSEHFDNLLNWTLQRQQILPQHKLEIGLWALSTNSNIKNQQQKKSFIHWLFNEWEHWHDENAKQKKEEFFVMKAAKSKRQNEIEDGENETTNDEKDLEEQQIRAYLPDYSESNIENDEESINALEEGPEHLSGDEINSALQAIYSTYTNQADSSNATKFPFLSFMQIRDQFKMYPTEDFELNSSQLYCLAEIRNLLKFDEKNLKNMNGPSILNVYKESDLAALIECLKNLEPLLDCSNRLLTEFPENAQLLQLREAINIYSSRTPADVPLMKHAAQLERILAHAEEWESISDRAHSIRAQMIPIQTLLVEWRQREVQCWNELIEHVRQDSTQLSLLVSWPLFKSALEYEETNDGSKLLLMFLEWIQNSTLGDFETRLWTGRLLSTFLTIIEDKLMDKPSLSSKILSIVCHFDQFKNAVQAKYSIQFKAIENELRNFTRVVRYTDLNLWSVRDSAKKAHVQLFRILRKYKELYNESISTLLLDKLPKVIEIVFKSPIKFLPIFAKFNLPQSPFTQMISMFGSRFESLTLELFDFEGMDVLKQNANDLFQLIKTDLNYEGPNEDGNGNQKSANDIKLANEKMQGRALFERQQLFAQLIRTTKQIGLSARRAKKLDSEALTMQILTEMPPLDNLDGSDMVNQLIRHVVASRNVFLRQFASIRRQQQPHLANQVSVPNLEHLHGIVEFGLHWLYSAIHALEQKVVEEYWRFQQITQCFDAELCNFNNSQINSIENSHRQMNSLFLENRKNYDQIASIVEQMRQILFCCPKKSSEFVDLTLSIRNLQEPLGPLHQDDEDYKDLLSELKELDALVQRVIILHKEEEKHVLKLPIGNNRKEWPSIWRRDRWNSYELIFNELIGILKASLNDETKIRHYFPNESEQIHSIIEKQFTQNLDLISESFDQFKTSEFDQFKNSLLLNFQSIYKEIEQLVGDNAVKLLDSIKQLIGFISRSRQLEGSGKLCSLFLSILSTSSNEKYAIKDLLENSSTLAKGASIIFSNLLNYLREFICQLASFQTIWIEIGCHLLAKGFVNPIPDLEPTKGEDKTVKDGCGFGEGEMTGDARDVGAELESMEQIEGLKDDGQSEGDDQNQSNQDQAGQQQKLPEVDQPIDIEDDFAANLEGLDADEQDGQEEIDEGEEQAGEQANWDFGDVDEPEETQLDPKLWESEMEDKQENEMKEGGKEGAQELTGELAAAEEEAAQNAEGAEHSEQNQQLQKEMEEGEEEMTMDNDAEMQQKEGDNVNEGDEEFEEMPNGEEGGTMEDDVEMNEVDERLEMEQNNDNDEMDIEEEQKENGDEREVEAGHSHENVVEEEENSPAEQTSKEFEAQTQQPEAIGVQEGTPNAGQTEAETGDQSREKEADGNCEAEGRNKKIGIAAQTAKNSSDSNNEENEENQGEEQQNKQKEMAHQKSPAEEASSQSVEKGEGNNEIENNTNELEPSEEENFSAQATSTQEQARRTRKLFDASLQRLKKLNNKELAEQNEEKRKETSKMGENGEEGMDLDANNEGKIVNAEEGNDHERNIFIQFADKQQNAKNILGSNDDIDTRIIDNLCSEFDRMEQNTQSSNDDQERMTLELQRKWAIITDSIAPLAAELTESLRTILEPTVANRLQGDYRTGKRLNMRRLITFIASDYRKDRIWLRRTKLAKRNYQICIAVDNSQSMQHNHMTEITCNALCMIQRALHQLEIGQLAICSFGSQVNLVNDFTSATGDDATLGIRILRELKFDQQRTDLAGMLSSTNALFKMARERSIQSAEQMLIIIGDGRGVLTEGVERINKALTMLNSQHVTVLFLIMDAVDKSITQMRIADFNDGKCTFRPYMQSFPFQLFALVKNTHSLPATMAEAVRQWFEYTSRS